ncbi:DUF4365 domain-containing protein [Arenimonas metalli]|uniref:DUF4365 domain-containing protein n=1 Tax=Arenimonas metalli TaxID=948077 RepID=UPI00054D9BAE|nr:DUF4365 domain-containing protein [Arenimonas metalli]
MAAPKTERLGVSTLDHFFSRNGWLFREQTTHDYGIDAHVEIVEKDRPTGKLIAFQIKSGASFFAEETDTSFVFRTDDKHVAYWVGHSMPVVLALYNPASDTVHWKQVTRESIQRTKSAWKIEVPKNNVLADVVHALGELASITQPEPYIRRLNRLRIDRKWMDLIQQGVEVRVTFDDWINKGLSRFQVTIYTEEEKEAWPVLYTPGVDVGDMLEHFFPWADFAVDEEEYREGVWSIWEANSYQGRDSETGTIFYGESFEDWYEPPNGIVPVAENGETETYVLLLSLNNFGRSFLAVDDYLSDPNAAETIGFTMD